MMAALSEAKLIVETAIISLVGFKASSQILVKLSRLVRYLRYPGAAIMQYNLLFEDVHTGILQVSGYESLLYDRH